MILSAMKVKRNILFSSIALLVSFGIYVLLFSDVNFYQRSQEQKSELKFSNQRLSVKEQWSWAAFEGREVTSTTQADAENNKNEVAFDVVSIHAALSGVRLDKNGHVIVDVNARMALEKAFRQINKHIAIDAIAIKELKSLIEIGLPGIAGKEVSDIVSNYFLLQKDLQEISKNQSAQLSSALNAESLIEDQESLERLAKIRREYLGKDVADSFYGGDQAHQRYMLSRKTNELDSSLTKREIIEKKLQLKKDLEAGYFHLDSENADVIDRVKVNKDSWVSQGLEEETIHYLHDQTLGLLIALKQTQQLNIGTTFTGDWIQLFEAERAAILMAVLSEKDKIEQIDWLLREYFSNEELELAQNSLPKISR